MPNIGTLADAMQVEMCDVRRDLRWGGNQRRGIMAFMPSDQIAGGNEIASCQSKRAVAPRSERTAFVFHSEKLLRKCTMFTWQLTGFPQASSAERTPEEAMANDDSNMDTNSKPPQGGTKLDNRYPDGVGEVSPDQPVLPSRQPISTSKDVTKRKK